MPCCMLQELSNFYAFLIPGWNASLKHAQVNIQNAIEEVCLNERYPNVRINEGFEHGSDVLKRPMANTDVHQGLKSSFLLVADSFADSECEWASLSEQT